MFGLWFETRRKHYLKAHIEKVHRNGTDTDFPCTECQKNFKWKASLNLHIKNVHKKSYLVTNDNDIEIEDGDTDEPKPEDTDSKSWAEMYSNEQNIT